MEVEEEEDILPFPPEVHHRPSLHPFPRHHQGGEVHLLRGAEEVAARDSIRMMEAGGCADVKGKKRKGEKKRGMDLSLGLLTMYILSMSTLQAKRRRRRWWWGRWAREAGEHPTYLMLHA